MGDKIDGILKRLEGGRPQRDDKQEAKRRGTIGEIEEEEEGSRLRDGDADGYCSSSNNGACTHVQYTNYTTSHDRSHLFDLCDLHCFIYWPSLCDLQVAIQFSASFL